MAKYKAYPEYKDSGLSGWGGSKSLENCIHIQIVFQG